METITITFGEQAENHIGMQKLGLVAKDGFLYEELLCAQKLFENRGFVCEMIDLNEALRDIQHPLKTCTTKAHLLVIRSGVNAFVDATQLYSEQKNLTPDTKAFMYGRVVNKKARYNLCFSDTAQEPDYINKKGTVIAFQNVPILSHIRNNLPLFFGKKANHLEAEGNYYYDVTQCGIGYHGDSERKRVVALRLGASLPLRFRWFCHGIHYGKDITIMLHHGDMYAMSEWATGCNWKKKSLFTLRHATGCNKFID